MYREELKKVFLENLPTDATRNNFTGVFNKTEPIERELNKDISNFTRDECFKAFKELNPASIKHIEALRSQLDSYGRWAKNRGLTARSWWGSVPTDERFAALEFERRHVKGLEELEVLVEENMAHLYDKYVVYLLFIGVAGERFSEISAIKDEDVDRIHRTITTPRRVYANVPPQLLVLKSEYEQTRKPRDEGSPYFIKPFLTNGIKNEPITHQYVYRCFQNLAGTKVPTPTTIRSSGMYHMAYQIEQSKGGSFTKDDYKLIQEVYDYRAIFGVFMREYELYKEVFWKGKAARE